MPCACSHLSLLSTPTASTGTSPRSPRLLGPFCRVFLTQLRARRDVYDRCRSARLPGVTLGKFCVRGNVSVLHVRELHLPPRMNSLSCLSSSRTPRTSSQRALSFPLGRGVYTSHLPSCNNAPRPFSLALACTRLLVHSFPDGVPRFHATPSIVFAPFRLFHTSDDVLDRGKQQPGR